MRQSTAPGRRLAACTAIDAAGNIGSAVTGYSEVYGFQGFSAPVQNPSILNVIKAGCSVPLRWRLVDATGAPVSNLTGAGVTVGRHRRLRGMTL